jgi:hypothetical protein
MRFIITLCLLLTFSQASQKPTPDNTNKKCNCAVKLKTCLKFAKSKQAKQACKDDHKECIESCVE